MRSLSLLVLTACAATTEVRVSAAPAKGGGAWVRFRRERPTGRDPRQARVEASGGHIEELLHSPDLRTVAVLWREPEGDLRCSFPYGGEGIFRSGQELAKGDVEYVFLEAPGVVVTARLPRGCVMRRALDLRVQLEDSKLPARLRVSAREPVPLDRSDSLHRYELPSDPRGALLRGDHAIVIEDATGGAWPFLISIDRDGTPAAVSGYIRNW
ncbi:MAG: hypothetical protein ACYTGV_13850 [Planctomycetota bacterium]|jgi:hypothetical protein